MNRTEKGNVILITRRAEKGNNFTNSLHTEDSPTFDSETEGQPWQKRGFVCFSIASTDLLCTSCLVIGLFGLFV